MRISPLDIKKQEFATRFRGYSREEVHDYLDMVASELEEALKKNLELEQKITAMNERLSAYARMESILQETLITTQKAAEETRIAADKKAGAMISEAQLHAQRIANDAKEQILKVQREVFDLTNQRDNFILSFKSLLETQLSLLDTVEKRVQLKTDAKPIPRKVDLSDEELEKIVDEFEKSLKRQNSPGA